MSQPIYDAHCHIFNLRYLLKEAKSLVRDAFHGVYPWDDASGKKSFALPNRMEEIKMFLKQAYELVRASVGTEEQNLDFLQKQAAIAYPTDKLSTIPLMMDIFYMLAYPLSDNMAARPPKPLPKMALPVSGLQMQWDDILDDFSVYITNTTHPVSKSFDASALGAHDVIKDAIALERNVNPDTAPFNKLKTALSFDFYKTDGFSFHLENLIQLAASRKGQMFPFVAIDPRRPGIIDDLKAGRLVSLEGPFYGVKLYPRMGYHAKCLPLIDVYQYCHAHKIPITFHCGKSGFPPGEGWKHAHFGNPADFESLLSSYPDINFNFAHFGSAVTDIDWRDTVLRLINQYDNAYTDLSCYTKLSEIQSILPLWQINPKLKERLMFGTDFDVMYFTAKVTMQDYYKNFQSVFGSDFDLLLRHNPAKFMRF